jgi:type IV pilus assembly protein PilA
MTATILRPQLRQALLRQLQKDSKRKRNILQQGFTLVELMIVIVIVGILSAVALPNFLSQTSKAKATECNTKAGAIMSQVAAEHLSSSADAGTLLTAEIGTATTNSALCTFSAPTTTLEAPIYGVEVAGKGDLEDKYSAAMCINAETGARKLAYKMGTDAVMPSC